MNARPIACCASAHDVLVDRLGNLSTAAGLALERLQRGSSEPATMARIVHGALEEAASLSRHLTPCGECRGCPRD